MRVVVDRRERKEKRKRRESVEVEREESTGEQVGYSGSGEQE